MIKCQSDHIFKDQQQPRLSVCDGKIPIKEILKKEVDFHNKSKLTKKSTGNGKFFLLRI